ncbi:MAG: hypothetical protein AUJ32_02165 [Parcubacteria group bacterium CG1_02_40_82]|uniref:Uncharacterized protein n=4 Tax=Candidatus Portnoyibacteriota TaxID=1817913 RepID=A0A2M7YNY5_9BACT|nr:MAG: hypothetical protein AUJ32_02165 [Parcubacteria group bacterium CG1_02_40_82]PJA64687.1 MAG: hypothetical protein CO159_01710 [Candidatus Portnoybacteria bacterium CG_4_9_14_3_um_filter_40_10]
MKIIKRKKFLIFPLLVIVFFLLSFAWQVFAQSNPTMELPNPLTATTFEDLVSSIATWFELIMVPLATIMILYAAFLFMTSGGDEEKIKRAKRAITWAVVGVAIVLIGAGFITLIKSFLSK